MATQKTPSTAETDIQLSQIWAGVRRGLTRLLAVTAAAGGLTYGALSLMAPRYASEAQLAIVAKTTNPFPEGRPGQTDNASPRLDKEAVNTHARALMAPELLLKVADELKLKYSPEFNSALGSVDTWSSLLRMVGIGKPREGESEEDRVLGVIHKQLEVAAAKESRFIPIRFTSIDQQLAADFANRLAETYRASLVSAPVEETGEVVKALTPKVEQLKKEVLEAEAEVERYRATSDQLRAGPQSTPVVQQRVASLNDELTKAEAAKAEAEARWRTAHEMVEAGNGEVMPDVQKSSLIQALISQRVRLERQIAEGSAAMLPGHPRMRQMEADLASLKKQIKAEVQKIVQGFAKEMTSAQLRIDGVNKQLATLKGRAFDQSGNEARLNALESTAKSKRAELERLQKQLEDNRTVVNTRQVPVEAQIISKARPNGAPVFPRTGSTTMLAMASAFILGLAILITRTLISPPLPAGAAGDGAKPKASGRREDLPAKKTQPAIAGVALAPAAATPARGQASTAMSALSMDVAALVERLATNAGTTGLRTLVTSEQPSIEVTTHARAVAEALAGEGKRVVLIVWSTAGRGLPIARTALKRPGIIDLLLGRATFEQVIGRIPGSDVHIIQPGPAPLDAKAVLDPDRLNLVLDALDEAYEQIVVAGALEEAAALFEAIEGRFDAAVVIDGDPSIGSSVDTDGGRLLGFEVAEIDIVRWPLEDEPPVRVTGPAAKAAKRAGERRLEPAL